MIHLSRSVPHLPNRRSYQTTISQMCAVPSQLSASVDSDTMSGLGFQAEVAHPWSLKGEVMR